MAEIHVAVSISWMGHTKKQTNTHKKKHDDMLSCCATKKVGCNNYFLVLYPILLRGQKKAGGLFVFSQSPVPVTKQIIWPFLLTRRVFF